MYGMKHFPKWVDEGSRCGYIVYNKVSNVCNIEYVIDNISHENENVHLCDFVCLSPSF